MAGRQEDGLGRFRIGLRTIKTALAVFICLLVHFLFGTETGLYSCMAAVVCMRETAEKSWEIGIHRFLGTLVGGVLGYFLVELVRYMPHYQDGGYIIVIPLGMILGIWLCLLINKKNGVIICCVVFICIGLDPTLSKASTLYHVALRVVDTIIGVVIAGLVNRYFFPYYEGYPAELETARGNEENPLSVKGDVSGEGEREDEDRGEL